MNLDQMEAATALAVSLAARDGLEWDDATPSARKLYEAEAAREFLTRYCEDVKEPASMAELMAGRCDP